MATNREKYIDNASNEELARTLTTGFYRMRTNINISEKYLDVKKWIYEWLSQETEEDKREEEKIKVTKKGNDDNDEFRLTNKNTS